MFNKNAKFKLWFWGIVFVICAALGTVGAVKHFSDTKEQREKDRVSSKKSSDIIIEGNILSNKTYEANLSFIVISILNDSYEYLEYNNNEISLTDKGKLTTAVKYMYLSNEINLTDGVSNKEQDDIVKKTKELFGDYVKYENFDINYSSGFCGSAGFDSELGSSYGGDEKIPSGSCESPFILFSTDKFRYDKDTYVVSVNVGLVSEHEYVQDGNDTYFEEITCATNETQVFKTINLYSDESKSRVAYTRDVTACCTTDACKSAGIMKIKNDLIKALPNLGETYLFRFDMNKDGKTFKLVGIEKSA